MSNELKQVITLENCKFTKTSLSLKESLKFEEWEKIGEVLKTIQGAIMFWIGDWLNFGERKYGETYAQASKTTGYEVETLRNAAYVAEKVEVSRRRDTLSFGHHQNVAQLDSRDQEKWLSKAEQEDISVRDLRTEISKTKILPSTAIPEGKYTVIYADPPWDIGSMVLDKWESPLNDKYPTMSEKELADLAYQIIPLKAHNCVCFMWTTLSTLPQALALLNVWGFIYHITLTWDKGSGWCSHGFHRKTELIIVGYFGNLTHVLKQEGEYVPTVFSEKKTTHSTKPEIAYELIEKHTIGPKIELFQRKKRSGWTGWGNEV